MAQGVLASLGKLSLFVLRYVRNSFPVVSSKFDAIAFSKRFLTRCEYSQMNWCLFHPDQPQYLGPVTEGRMAGPAGRYPCCGQQAFRFETLPGPMV